MKDLAHIFMFILLHSIQYKNCKYRKRLIDKLVDECTENIEETRLVEKTSAKNENNHKCSSCTLYIALFSVIFTINIGVGTYFAYFHWYIKKVMLMLYLIPILKQQFIRLINGRS